MDEENLPQNVTEEIVAQSEPKKRRGRKPKALKEAEGVAEGVVEKKPRRKSKKIDAEQELPLQVENFAKENFESEANANEILVQEAQDNYDEEAEYESYSRNNREIENNIRNDEFSYTGDSDYAETEADEEDADEDIPTHFSTELADLEQDSYRNREDDFDSESEDEVDQQVQNQNRQYPQNNRHYQNNRNNRNSQRGNQNNQQNRNNRNSQNNRNNNRNNNQRNNQQNRNNSQNRNQQNKQNQNRQNQKNNQSKWLKFGDRDAPETFNPTVYSDFVALNSAGALSEFVAKNITEETPIFEYSSYYGLSRNDLQNKLSESEISFDRFAGNDAMFASFLKHVRTQKGAILVEGILDVFEGGLGGAICFASDSYKLKKYCVFVPQKIIEQNGLLRGCKLKGLAVVQDKEVPQEKVEATSIVAEKVLENPAEETATEVATDAPVEVAAEEIRKEEPKQEAEYPVKAPVLVKVESVMDMSVEDARALTPFNELTPYYPTRRIIMEAEPNCGWDNLSMRVVDLLTPIGLGQRALIVAPPRTGKTVLMQGMAKSIRRNVPDAHLIVLMVDERPEEVTDFKRSVDAEIVASTFDEDAFSHVHAAEMVISKARRMVEAGKDVIILLDSITRLARAYNTLMPNSGKIMSGGVEANALQKPKRFFGSARNIEGGGSLTIIGTALVETGSKMDEVIFEEFKGTGNLELHLDRSLVEKRIFPALNIEKSGTRKEELLYHPDEMNKIYQLRRAMKGVPSAESMELLLQRLKKVKTNIEFLVGINR